MEYAIGSLVQTRGREWVVLPDFSPDFLLLRPPADGSGNRRALPAVERKPCSVRQAPFSLSTRAARGWRLSFQPPSRHGACLGFRSSAGRLSLLGSNVEPRPYQLVPLLMALKLDPVRLLIADDVGIGQDHRSGRLIARELLDRGESAAAGRALPTPPGRTVAGRTGQSSSYQAELVLPGTVQRLNVTPLWTIPV